MRSRRFTQWAQGKQIDRVICLWEPGVLLAARLREELGAPGMTVEECQPFRDKDMMKEKVAKAGIRTPKHNLPRAPRACAPR